MKKSIGCLSGGVAALVFAAPLLAADIDAAPPYDWSGFYGGIQGNYNWFDPNSSQPSVEVQPKSDGVGAGLYLGANWQQRNFVLGVETDGNLTDLGETSLCSNPAWGCNAGSDWNLSFRGRAGVAMDRALVFVTGGYAVADFNGYTVDGTGVRFKDSKTLDGWVLGGGLEYAVTDRILIRGEYRHYDFGAQSMRYDSTYGPMKPNEDSLIFGVGYKF